MLKMAVLLSGSGRTLDNFHERIEKGSLQAQIQVVISNVEGVLGLQKADNYGYPAFYAQDNDAINSILKDYDVDIIALAGYLKLYSPPPSLKKIGDQYPPIPYSCILWRWFLWLAGS